MVMYDEITLNRWCTFYISIPSLIQTNVLTTARFGICSFARFTILKNFITLVFSSFLSCVYILLFHTRVGYDILMVIFH